MENLFVDENGEIRDFAKIARFDRDEFSKAYMHFGKITCFWTSPRIGMAI